MEFRENREAEELQDEIFKRMTPDEKLGVGAQLWRMAKDIVGDKITSYERRRSPQSSHSDRTDS